MVLSETAQPVKTYLVGGFLGAGKTTFILDQLSRMEANVAVLVNEFGTLGIDGETIRTKGGVEVVEMPGGCICCSQKDDLAASVKAIVENIKPDLLLIEPSGVAGTSQLLRALGDKSLDHFIELCATIAIVDPTTFEEFFQGFGNFFRNQIENADVIIVNKRDLVDRETLKKVERRIGALNRRAQVVLAEHCRVDLPVAGSLSPVVTSGHHDHHMHGDSLGLNALSFELARPLTREELDGFISELSTGSFGDVLRVKGFVEMRDGGFVSIEATSAVNSIRSLEGRPTPRMTIIGRGLKEDMVASRFDVVHPEKIVG